MKALGAFLILLLPSLGHAALTGGTTLLETPNARPAALAEAFTAATDDISGFAYNPASLSTLNRSHFSFLYQKGIAEDNYGQLMVGTPSTKGGIGFSFGYYNGGDITLFDGDTERTVNAKRDLTASFGYARHFGSKTVGIAGKYISSELAEKYKAAAYAVDAGMQMRVVSRVRFGAAVQNIGSKIQYLNEATDLPQTARAGLAISLFKTAYKTTLSLDAPYYMKDRELRTAIGLETFVGPLALRAGYRTGELSGTLTFGAGFALGSMTLDYSYGLVQDFDATHKVSVGMRFGEATKENRL